MLIQAGGHQWRVEVRERRTTEAVADGDSTFSHLTFLREDAEEECLELGWVPRGQSLDADVARTLFELAGRRRWRDPRDSRRYDAELLPTGPDEEISGPIHVRFSTEDGPVGTTIYPLPRPLGLATVTELQAMVDVALERERMKAGR